MKFLALILTALVLPVVARSSALSLEPVHQDELQLLLKSRSSAQLADNVSRLHRSRHLTSLCEAQLRWEKVPIACFELTRLFESTWSTESAKRWLGELCEARVASSRDWKELTLVSRIADVPQRCRELAGRRRADLLYAQQAVDPVEAFKKTFQR